MKHLSALLSLILLTSCSTAVAPSGMDQPEQPSAAEPVKIGFIGPLTGGVAGLGMDVLHGAQMKLAELNAGGGILERPIILITEDGKCTGADAAVAARKLIDVDRVVAIHGGECSGETLAAAPIAEAAGVVMLSPSSSSPDVSKAGDYIFRMYPSDALKTKAMAQYFSDEGFQRIAIVTENADFTEGFRTALKADVPAEHIAFDETVAPDTKDFRTILTRLRRVEFDAIVLNINSSAGIALLLRQLREQGLEQLAISHDLGESQEIIDLIGNAAEGMQVINVPSLAEKDDFSQKFTAAYGKPQANITWGAYGYDVLGILAQAIREVGTDGSAIRDYLYNLPSYEGIIATVSFDENGDVLGIPYALKEVRNGAFMQIADISVD